MDILGQIFDNYDINIFAHEETGNRLTFERDLNVLKRCKDNNIYIKECINSWIVRRLKNRNDRHKIRKERMNSDIFQIEKKKSFFESEYITNIYKNSMKDFPINYTNSRRHTWLWMNGLTPIHKLQEFLQSKFYPNFATEYYLTYYNFWL